MPCVRIVPDWQEYVPSRFLSHLPFLTNTVIPFKDEETLRLALKAHATDAEAVGEKPSGTFDGDWYREGDTGVFRCGSKPGAQYTTLYHTVTIGKKIITRRELYIPPMEEQMRDRCVSLSVL